MESGIWKTVWLESVPEEYIESLKITAMYDEAAVKIQVEGHRKTSAEVEVQVLSEGNVVAEVTGEIAEDIVIPLGYFIPWTTENPYLYDLKITYGQDEVSSYFGMRKFSVGKDKKGILRFFMNNRPFFFNGVLDQGYWPESLYKRLWEEEIYPNLERGLSATIYTQTSDIEEEINGLMTYDR